MLRVQFCPPPLKLDARTQMIVAPACTRAAYCREKQPKFHMMVLKLLTAHTSNALAAFCSAQKYLKPRGRRVTRRTATVREQRQGSCSIQNLAGDQICNPPRLQRSSFTATGSSGEGRNAPPGGRGTTSSSGCRGNLGFNTPEGHTATRLGFTFQVTWLEM